jgi:hypothetical protein
MAAILAVAGLLLGSLPFDSAIDSIFVEETSFGSFEQATRITVGPQGWIYIIDARKNAVLVFKSVREEPAILGGFGWSASAFDNPTGIATDGLNIYISDYGNHRIQRFDRSSNLISTLFTRDTSFAPARIGYPVSVSLTNMGELLVLDSENLKVVKFSSDSRYERSFGDLTDSGGKLQNPVKLCVAGEQYVYVIEKSRILQFDSFGNYLRSMGTNLPGDIVGGTASADGISIVCRDTLYEFRSDGSVGGITSLATLITETPVRYVQDIAIVGHRLFVLTPHRCHLFTIQSTN